MRLMRNLLMILRIILLFRPVKTPLIQLPKPSSSLKTTRWDAYSDFGPMRLLENPTMRPDLVRHHARAYFTGLMLCTTRIAALAAVSSSWFRSVLTELSDEWCLRTHYLEQVSRANRLPCEIIKCTEDEYIARYTGRVCRNLQWGRIVSPLH